MTNCYKIGEKEALKLLGDLKIGVALDILRFKDIYAGEALRVNILPYSFTKIYDSKVSTAELDKYRAKLNSGVLKSNRIK